MGPGAGNQSGTESDVHITANAAGTLSNFHVAFTTAPGFGNTWTFTVRKNGSTTTVTCNANNTATTTTVRDPTHTVSFAAGDKLSISIVPASGPSSETWIFWSASFS